MSEIKNSIIHKWNDGELREADKLEFCDYWVDRVNAIDVKMFPKACPTRITKRLLNRSGKILAFTIYLLGLLFSLFIGVRRYMQSQTVPRKK